ncbi:Protein kintoun [Geranomyces variabilis]|uniref:Protein kintoun n=1 Tax=Geranomyces variabilis TaxID=109894 RepID=A0AAD5TRB7_9FUNG|nr:Protein kintoun [Geranomyces variabilis]
MASANERKAADITAEEFKKIETSLQNKEFRAMFFDYMQEISDPENRKIYEAELTQLEAERGNDVRFVTPTPGHVVKTRAVGGADAGKKVFINMCTSPEIEAATPGKTAVEAGAKGITWNIPYSLTKPKEDLDVGGKPCTVLDCVFHPSTYARGRDNPAFERLLVSTAMEGFQLQFGTVVEKNYRTPKMTFKGTPVATVIRTTKASAAGKTKLQQQQDKDPKAAFLESLGTATAGSTPLPSVSTAADPPLLPTLFPAPKTALAPPPPPLIEELSPAAGPSATSSVTSPPAIVEPKHTITHRGVRADYQEYTQERERQRGARPDALVVRIELPTVRSSNDITLTPLARSLGLRVEGKYLLDVALPFDVVIDASSASFDRAREVLEVVLPVVPAPDAVLPPSTASLEPAVDHATGTEDKDDEDEIEVPAVHTPIGSEDGDGWVKVRSPALSGANNKDGLGEPTFATPSSPTKQSPEKKAQSLTAAPVVLANTLMFDLDD